MNPIKLPSNSLTQLQRALFKLIGSDAERYLNGQVSQDLKLATDTHAVYAIVANFKGKLDADCYIRRQGKDIFIDCSMDLKQSLFERLDRYIIADDAELIDVTDDYQIIHYIEPDSRPSGGWEINRFGQAGYDIFIETGNTLPVSNLKNEELERARISHRIPTWGAELDHDTLPPEAGLEDRAISYHKGCYTGQEVISRIRAAGKTNRHLVLLELSEKVEPMTPLLCEGASLEKPAGVITSYCCLDKKHIALAYRKRKYQDHTSFSANNAQANVID